MLIEEPHQYKIFMVNMKYWRKLLYLVCICSTQYFVVGETKSINDDIAEGIYSYDYTRIETQFERLNLHANMNHETQLRQQKELLENLERKFNALSMKVDGIQEKLFDTIKINTENLKDFIRTESQTQVPIITPIVGDEILSMIDIKEKLKKHEQILNEIIRNENDTRQLIKEIDMADHSQAMKNTISDNVDSLHKKDEKSKAIEDISLPKIHQLNFYQDIHNQFDYTEKVENNFLASINQSYPTSCADFNANFCTMNKCLIKNHLYGPVPFSVACNNSEDGVAWTVIQRRINGAVDFDRDWSEHKYGFGDIDAEFFIGLEKLHALTSTLKPVELFIQLQDFENVTKYAKYDDFQLGNETENYKLIKLGSYAGDAGDSFSAHVGYNFSTKDRDNSGHPYINCAEYYTAGWWYHDCYRSNLNGKYYQHPTKFYNVQLDNRGINWYKFHGFYYSLKSVQMMIRPRKL